MRTVSSSVTCLALSVVALASVSACVDEKIVYRDRELFEDPPTAAGEFLGYTDHDTKLTVCGNCHIEKQGDWEQTLHAGAWAGLQDSGHAQESCEGCHTVNQLGNYTTAEGGFLTTGDERYEDVQCEACHGPGLTHVSSPTGTNVPLAPITVGVGFETGCGECHSDAHHPFVEEWVQSRHGDAANQGIRTREGCTVCHNGEGALESWGIDTNFIEKGQGEAIGITCAVCHNPHGGPNEHQLRFPIDVPEVNTNLCMKCHQRRAIPDEASTHGPHSPQGPLLLGEIGTVGWTPPNLQYEQATIRGTHGSEANERLCAGCHVNAFTVNDSEGNFLISATGHLFKPIPCLDENGIPTGDDSCPKTTEARSFNSCTKSGCHGSADAALSALLIAQNRIHELTLELGGLLDQVPADAINHGDGILTIAEGATFNLELGEIESSAVHNPFLTEALLTASIKAVEDEYGVAALSSVSLENLIGTPALR
jgi:predicted CXXCH cytochrome family protein